MTATNGKAARRVIALPPGGGRRYAMGGLTAPFKADEAGTGAAYSISEWILEPGQPGVGPHSHAAHDEVFMAREGRPEILVGTTWQPCATGTFLRIPPDTVHDFRNLTDRPARLLNVLIPGGFEREMPGIAAWFAQSRPDADGSAGTPA